MHYRFIEESDFEELATLEKRLIPGKPDSYYRCQPTALRFFARSGHSFVAANELGIQGFVLAQAIWQGDRATVLVTRIVSNNNTTYKGLLNALIKSAYDANAYEVALLVAQKDRGDLYLAAKNSGFASSGLELLVRILGSRGENGQTTGVFE